MKLRTKVLSAALAAAAFILTPSPVTPGQASMSGYWQHVDSVLVMDSDQFAPPQVQLRAIDLLVLTEVRKITASSAN